MDNLDLFPDFDIDAFLLECDLDLTLPDFPEPTLDEMQAIAHLLPANFGEPPVTPPPAEPSQSSLTFYSEKISIRIPRPILAIIKEYAKLLGIPYQTYINMMLADMAGRAQAARNSKC